MARGEDFIESTARKNLGPYKHPYHQPGDEPLLVAYVPPDHTTQTGA